MDRRTPDDTDAELDLAGARSGVGAFLAGMLVGVLVSAAAVAAAMLAAPPPPDLPLAGRADFGGPPPAPQGEPLFTDMSSEPPGETSAEPPAEAPTEAPAEPAPVAIVPQGSGAVVPQTADAMPPETTAPKAMAPEAMTQETKAPGEASPESTAPPASAPSAISSDSAPAVPTPSDAAPAETGPADDGPANTLPGDAGIGPGGSASPAEGPEQPPAAALAPAESADPADKLATAPETPPDAAAAPTGRALIVNARPFDAPRTAPLLAVVLVGDAVTDLTAERMSLLTMPLTIAIPPDSPHAARLAADARAAGHEVLADLSLSAEAGTGDPAAAVARRIAALDVAVGATTTDDTTDADQLAPVLSELDRHGFAWVGTGAAISTPAERIARKIGMPYTQGNKVISGDADPEQLYRAIDIAAHQARQWGTAVLFLGTSEPALDALVRWGLEQRDPNFVWFAPISAVIQRRTVR